MSTPHPHLHYNELQCLSTAQFWSHELRCLKIEQTLLQKICKAMAMSCFVQTKGPAVLEVGYSIDYDMTCGIPEGDYECFEALAEAGMALHVKAFAGMSRVKLQHTPSFDFDIEEIGRAHV